MSPPITPTTPISPKEYDITTITAEDKTEVLNFLRDFFFTDEPLNKSIGIVSEGPSNDLENFCLEGLEKELSLKAVLNGEIIGVSINGFLEKGYIDGEIEHTFTDPQFQKIYRLLDRVGRESDVFARFPDCDKAMTVKIISVNGAFRGQGIAKELMNRSRNLAKELGCGFMSVDCTSHFTALALRKLGFECHYKLKYADHKENGEVVFTPEPPHEAVTVYVQKI